MNKYIAVVAIASTFSLIAATVPVNVAQAKPPAHGGAAMHAAKPAAHAPAAHAAAPKMAHAPAAHPAAPKVAHAPAAAHTPAPKPAAHPSKPAGTPAAAHKPATAAKAPHESKPAAKAPHASDPKTNPAGAHKPQKGLAHTNRFDGKTLPYGKSFSGKDGKSHTYSKAPQGMHPSTKPYNYSGWSQYCWFPSFDVVGFYSADDLSWYYWYEPFLCYVPVTYMTEYPPVQPVNGPVPDQSVVPQQQGGTGGVTGTHGGHNAPAMPALPQGATLLPKR